MARSMEAEKASGAFGGAVWVGGSAEEAGSGPDLAGVSASESPESPESGILKKFQK